MKEVNASIASMLGSERGGDQRELVHGKDALPLHLKQAIERPMGKRPQLPAEFTGVIADEPDKRPLKGKG